MADVITRPRVDIAEFASRKITREDVLARYSVDLESGRVYWLPGSVMRNRPVLGEAGCLRRSNVPHAKHYWIIKVGGVPIKRSRVVFLVAHGYQPHPTVDHIDGNSVNDAIANLREASFAGNSRNRKYYSPAHTNPMGTRKNESGTYTARICVDRKLHVIGTYATEAEASAAYQAKRVEFFGEFA